MTNFADRLDRAIERGSAIRRQSDVEQAQKELSHEEAKSVHAETRLALTEHIEEVLRAIMDHFPGFTFESVYSEDGWGGRITRNDVSLGRPGNSRELYSRFELLISPFGKAVIVELVGKATIQNKERFNRRHFERIQRVKVDSFREVVDLWALEYAEQYAAAT